MSPALKRQLWGWYAVSEMLLALGLLIGAVIFAVRHDYGVSGFCIGWSIYFKLGADDDGKKAGWSA